jgi:hypothetical protein
MGGLRRTSLAILSVCLTSPAVVAQPPPGKAQTRWFPDRPVAWSENDDADVPKQPKANNVQIYDTTLILRDGVVNEIDRYLSVEGRRPARDVNARDEVPCSTWFCPRNHLRPMPIPELITGPPAPAPVLPITIVKGKNEGAAAGFQVKDATGRKFMLKLDPAKAPGIATAGELIGARLFHAAGWDVPGSFLVHLAPDQLLLDPKATHLLYEVQKRPLTRKLVDELLAKTARAKDGRLRAAAVLWLDGTSLGAMDQIGTRADDPNDRIPHQDRRSLRAAWVMFAWLSIFDASSVNSLDTYVEENGRRFVRHHFIDFGCSFGSATAHAQSPREDGEHTLEVGRTLLAFFSLGAWHRPFQDQRQSWALLTRAYPSIGYYPAEGFNPDNHRTNRKVPSHVRKTDRDLYWGAKVVTAFTDEQLAAVVKTAEMVPDAAAYLTHALQVRRDIIGRRYMRPMTAVEEPALSEDGARVCFEDISLQRGYATREETRYGVDVSDGYGVSLLSTEVPAAPGRTCVPTGGAGRGTGYRIVRVATSLGVPSTGFAPAVAKPARIHLRWREAEKRFVVVGLERDE